MAATISPRPCKYRVLGTSDTWRNGTVKKVTRGEIDLWYLVRDDETGALETMPGYRVHTSKENPT